MIRWQQWLLKRNFSEANWKDLSDMRHGFFNFLLDAGLKVITGGLRLIWIFVREIRNR